MAAALGAVPNHKIIRPAPEATHGRPSKKSFMDASDVWAPLLLRNRLGLMKPKTLLAQVRE